MLVPLLGVLLVRGTPVLAAKRKSSDAAVNALRRFCGWIARRMVNRPGLYSLLGLLVVVGLGIVYADLEPRYRLADQVPDREQAVSASGSLDAKLTGANPIDVLIEFPPAPASMRRDAVGHHRRARAMEAQAGWAMCGPWKRCDGGLAERPGAPMSPSCASMWRC
jgi:uncharacterized membrane protein YdfJ with MMPL/SSD domain